MSKDAVFTIKIESELRADFMAEAAREDRPASQIMRELMRGYIAQSRQARDYDDFLRRKVQASRASMHAGQGRSNEEVDAAFAARRNTVSVGTV